MKQKWLILLVIIAATACSHSNKNDTRSETNNNTTIQTDNFIVETKSHPYLDSTVNVNENNIPLDENEFFFPLELFPVVETDWNQDSSGLWVVTPKIIEGVQDTFLVRWYSEHLYAMKEPLLFNKNLNKEVYRFTWLRTFDNPVVIRIENIGEKYKLTWKLCDGAGGYTPGNLKIDKSVEINPEKWEMFKSKLDELDYWNMSLGRMSFGTDGSEWILEGVNKEKYKVVTVWTPSKGKFYDACNYLLTLTDLEINETDKY
ncbi:MAG: hypothetical protein V2I54_01370 [Bacteroidales bacterium]|jgi:hypothetical protein|nr:hypothetical protein [Bacteroidales bacterium]